MLLAKDVCDVLGYLNSRDAIARHCKHAQKMTVLKQHSHRGGAQFITIIPESDMYRPTLPILR